MPKNSKAKTSETSNNAAQDMSLRVIKACHQWLTDLSYEVAKDLDGTLRIGHEANGTKFVIHFRALDDILELSSLYFLRVEGPVQQYNQWLDFLLQKEHAARTRKLEDGKFVVETFLPTVIDAKGSDKIHTAQLCWHIYTIREWFSVFGQVAKKALDLGLRVVRDDEE